MIKPNRYPKRSLGQNFLIDENIARKIVTSLALDKNNNVLEIGAGRGILTKYIVSNVKRFVVVEIDQRLTPDLSGQFADYPAFHLIEDDFLNLQLENIFSENRNWKIVGNIPYHITSSIIFKTFKCREYIQSLTLMVQKEVAQRICAKPNSKKYSILSVFSNLYTDVSILFSVSKNVFTPKPKVDSAVIQWQFLPQSRYHVEDESFFIQMIKAVFNQRRKILKNSLQSLGINNSNINFPLTQRPEQLSVAELVELSNLITYGRKRY